jgi:phospholipid/cholesterol/gamma-HCH transport system ATP-binding protein
MRRFKFGGFGGGGKDDQAPGSAAPPDSAAPPASAASPPASAAPGSAPEPATEQQPATSGTPAAEQGSGGHDSSSWIPPGQEPFAAGGGEATGGSGSDPHDEPAPIAGVAAATGAETPTSAADDHPGDGDQHNDQPQNSPEAGEIGDRDDEAGYVETEADHAPETQAQAEQERPSERSRVSVVDEQPARPAPPAGATEDEYRWHSYKHYPSGRPDAVEFVEVYKAFGRNRILRGLNMGLPEGMVSMIIGPSGTGKSVCIKHMVGLLYPDEGDILVHGESVPNMPDDDLFEMRKKFGLLFQDGALFGSMDLYDNVAFPLRQHTEKSEDEIEDIVMRRLNEVGLGSAREKAPNELSGGMRKRAGFARALVLEPDIVLFDEPDSGLDPVRTALLGELILEIHRDMMDEAKEKQKTHLPTFAVITHDIMSARRVADYINVLWRGRIVEAGPAEDMLNSDNPFIRQFLAGESQGPLTMD